MKKVIFTILLVPMFLCSCSQSHQEKAEKLVGNYLKEKLHNPQNYESISFSNIDSLFIKPNENEQCTKSIEYNKKAELCDNKRKLYLSTLEAKSDTMSDEYRKSEIWKTELSSAKSYLTSLIDSSRIYGEKAALEQLKYKFKGKFGGWMLVHKYKSKNQNGTIDIYTNRFFLDCNLTKVIDYKSE